MDGAQTSAKLSGGGLIEAGGIEVDGFLVGRRVCAEIKSDIVEEGSITRDSYSQASIQAKEVRKVITQHSSNRPDI